MGSFLHEMCWATACQTLLIAASATVAVAQEKPDKHYWCPMHPQVVGERAGKCPICGMEMVLGVATPDVVEIEPGDLREFCVNYVNEAMDRFSGSGLRGPSFLTPELYLLVHGDAGLPVVRRALEHPDLHRVDYAAWHLARVGDRHSVDLLLAQLSSERLAYSPGFYCRDHPGVRSDSPGTCRECGSTLAPRTTSEVVFVRMAVAGALHRLGRDEGLDALREMIDGPAGGYALQQLSLRDTTGVRVVLEERAKGDDPWLAACAVAAELHLGNRDRLAKALEFLRKGNSRHSPILAALAEKPCEDASDTLRGIVEDETESWERRSSAALALFRLGEKAYRERLVGACNELWASNDMSFPLSVLSKCADERHLSLFERVIEELPMHRELAVSGAVRVLFPKR